MTALWLALLAADPAPVPPIDAAEIERLRAELLPPARPERWETIPWRTDLCAARDEAERAGKLLFLWTMNGHPLGCT
jgi:hypothetical protein